MLGAERLLRDRQGTPVERLGLREAAGGLVQRGEVVEADGDGGMLGPSAFSRIARARRCSGSASARRPVARYSTARLLRLVRRRDARGRAPSPRSTGHAGRAARPPRSARLRTASAPAASDHRSAGPARQRRHPRAGEEAVAGVAYASGPSEVGAPRRRMPAHRMPRRVRRSMPVRDSHRKNAISFRAGWALWEAQAQPIPSY
jgi:hypothetical protein